MNAELPIWDEPNSPAEEGRFSRPGATYNVRADLLAEDLVVCDHFGGVW
jgi:hypothetical protein